MKRFELFAGFGILAAVVLLFTFILGGYGLILAASCCVGLLASCGD